MERILVGGALVFAALVAAGAFFSDGPSFIHISDDFEVGHEEVHPAGAEGMMDATVFSGRQLVLKDVAAVVKLLPEPRNDVEVTIAGGEKLPKIRVQSEGGEVVISGGLRGRVNCAGDGVTISGIGAVSRDALPVITVRVPEEVEADFAGTVFGDIGPSKALTLSVRGCGDTVVGDVQGPLELSANGSGGVRTGKAERAEVGVAGSGNVRLGDVTGDAEINVAGSGDVAAQAVGGELVVSIAGSGDVSVAGGAPTRLEANVAGSGNISVDAVVAGDVDAEVMGSGNVAVKGATGAVETRVLGSGSVKAPRPPAPPAPPAVSPAAPTPPAPPAPPAPKTP